MGWNDLKKDSNNGGSKSEIKFVSLQAGTHQLRCLDDEPYSRYTHWVQSANGGKGMTVDCIGRECPICEQIRVDRARKAPAKYTSRKLHAMNFIQRNLGNDNKVVAGEIGEVVVVDKGNRLYEALDSLRAEVGDLKGYDVKIRVNGEGTDTSYTPIPMPPKALTPEELALEKYDFSKIYVKLTREQMLSLMSGANIKDLILPTASDELEVDFTK